MLPAMGLLAQGEAAAREIVEVVFDLNRIHKWDTTRGDTWDPFWADDGNLYAFNCDGRGFGTRSMNMAFNRLSGDAPDALVGASVNEMNDYGKETLEGPDHATWKACGQECIDGVFYAFVSRNVYGNKSGDALVRQTAANASLIKSVDRGATWTRTAQDNYDRPMWPGSGFATPFFVHYGQNGGRVARDRAAEYVYAVSNDGFWCDGDNLRLGRVKRRLLARLSADDWKYFTGGDGLADRSWSKDVGRASALLDRPAKLGQTPVTYVPALGVYVLISWYNTEPLKSWYTPNEMRYDFFQAPHPWGPWTMVSSISDRFLSPRYHMYGPSLCAKFQERRGGDVQVSLFHSGCPFDDYESGPYKMWHIPVLLRTTARKAEEVRFGDKRLKRSGGWFQVATYEAAPLDQLPWATQDKGQSVELHFDGTGVEYVAQKTRGMGMVEVYLDGTLRETVNLEVKDFPALFGVTVFAAEGLAAGAHVLKLVNADDARINVEGFRIIS
jgi:hypothetical protein